jgi:TRAP-type mannitol/chloroaromatic compound transport system permease small subunit
MRPLFAFMRAVTRLNEWIGRLAAPVILALFLLLFAEVLLRYFFRSPTVWTNELAQLLFGAYAVLSGGYLLARGGHVNVDIIYAKFPRRVRAAIDILTSVLFFLFVAVLLWLGVSFALESIASLETSHSAWNPPIWPFKTMIPVAAGLLLLQGIVKLIADICAALGTAIPGDIILRHAADDEAPKEAL